MHAFFSSADLFFKIKFSKKYFRNTFIESNGLDPDKAQQNDPAGSDLGPNYICKRYQQKMLGRQRVKRENLRNSLTHKEKLNSHLIKISVTKIMSELKNQIHTEFTCINQECQKDLKITEMPFREEVFSISVLI